MTRKTMGSYHPYKRVIIWRQSARVSIARTNTTAIFYWVVTSSTAFINERSPVIIIKSQFKFISIFMLD